MMHCQITRDAGKENRSLQMRLLPYFCEDAYTGTAATKDPSVTDIVAFLSNVFEVGGFHTECCVIMLVYINRLIGVTDMPLSMNNWKPVATTALVLAQKVWDDTPLINADFHILYPVLHIENINYLERKFLALVGFKLSVPPSLYAQFYYELRSIFNNQESVKPETLPLKKLAEMQQRVHLSLAHSKGKEGHRQETMTLARISHGKTARLVIS